jgi:hypothetical protein
MLRLLSRSHWLPPSPTRRVPRVLLTLVVGVLMYGLLAPVLAIGHEMVVLGTASLLGDIVWLFRSCGLLRVLPLDPIYTSAMLLTIAGIVPRGLAIAGPVGDLLHATWPVPFEAPSLVAPFAFASAVVEPGATVISRLICGIVADAALLTIGLLAIQRGRRRHGWLVVMGAVIQANVFVAHLVDAPPALADIEAAGIPFAIAMLVSGDVQAGPRLSETLASLPDLALNGILGLGLVVLAYLPIVVVVTGLGLVRSIRTGHVQAGPRRATRSTGAPVARRQRMATITSRAVLVTVSSLGRTLVLGALAVGIVLSPVGDLADAQTHFLASTLDPDPTLVDRDASQAQATIVDQSPTSVAGAVGDPLVVASPVPSPAPTDPSIVAVAGSHYQYQYTVNGVPQVIRGIGYNVRYQSLPPDERARRLDRDFATLKKMGVNTVFGWDPAEFDEVLLDAAQRHGLGVAPPFDLDPDAAYGDPAVRDRVTHDVLTWVARYRQHPAVRMWAIGNEVLHKLVYPSWMPVRSDPAWEQRARDFASFYVELADTVHAADPNHPILHRDAEDAYFTWLRDAFGASERRPWLVYGVNAYTPRLAEILAGWPGDGWDVPLLVSEFAPGGMSPADRPQGFRSMWKMIRGAGDWTLGGAVYAWTTDGPEEVDRVFGLVDDDGKAVDGAFDAIGAIFRGAAHQPTTERSSPTQPRDERVWSFARQAIVDIQDGHAIDLLPVTADTSIMGDVNAVPAEPVYDQDLTVERVRDPRRVSWGRDTGVTAEWWITWLPPDQPRHKLTFVVQQTGDGSFGVRYIYRGPR